MRKELVQKIVESGIVPIHAVKQLKSWKQLSPDITEDEQYRVTHQGLLDFVHDIESLLESDGELPELRETVPGIESAFSSKSQACTVVVNTAHQTLAINTRALAEGLAPDMPSYYIFKADGYGEAVSRPGNQIWSGGDRVYEVTESTPLYCGEEVSFYRCAVQEVPRYAQVPELRRLSK